MPSSGIRSCIQFIVRLALACGLSANALAQGSSTATGTSNKLNPAISLNSLFLAQKSDAAQAGDGFRAQEFELTLVSIVDAHFRASASIAFEPGGAHDSGATDDAGEAAGGVEIEEGYVTTLGLPAGLGLKAGRFYLPLGRHNQLHTHQYPFIAPPRPVASILGEHGIGDVGLLASYLPDLPWYLDFQGYLTDGSAEPFDAQSRRLAAGGRIESAFELGDAATLELGGSALRGSGEADEDLSFVGADLRLKWRDNRRTHGRAVNWITEFLSAQSDRPTVSGVYSALQMRVSRQWWTGVEYGWTSLVAEEGGERTEEHEARVQLAWVPGEFSVLRGVLGWVDPEGGHRELRASLQLNFTIGAHPAHKY